MNPPNNKIILNIINPKDIIAITLNEEAIKSEYHEYKLLEESRGNKYIIFSIENGTEEYSGEFIKRNIAAFKNLQADDLIKIGYNTGLADGRSITNTNTTKTAVKDENKFKLRLIK